MSILKIAENCNGDFDFFDSRLRVGGDLGRRCERNPDRYFNPHLRVGGDGLWMISGSSACSIFQSTPPRRRRHTLSLRAHPFLYFNPRLREGGDYTAVCADKLSTTTSSGGLILALQRAITTARPEGRYRKHCYWLRYKAVLLESSLLESSACSLIYFCTASSVILPIVST